MIQCNQHRSTFFVYKRFIVSSCVCFLASLDFASRHQLPENRQIYPRRQTTDDGSSTNKNNQIICDGYMWRKNELWREFFRVSSRMRGNLVSPKFHKWHNVDWFDLKQLKVGDRSSGRLVHFLSVEGKTSEITEPNRKLLHVWISLIKLLETVVSNGASGVRPNSVITCNYFHLVRVMHTTTTQTEEWKVRPQCGDGTSQNPLGDIHAVMVLHIRLNIQCNRRAWFLEQCRRWRSECWRAESTSDFHWEDGRPCPLTNLLINSLPSAYLHQVFYLANVNHLLLAVGGGWSWSADKLLFGQNRRDGDV